MERPSPCIFLMLINSIGSSLNFFLKLRNPKEVLELQEPGLSVKGKSKGKPQGKTINALLDPAATGPDSLTCSQYPHAAAALGDT